MSASVEIQGLGDAVAAEVGKIHSALREEASFDTRRLAALVDDIHALSRGLDPAEAATVKPRLLGLLADLDAVQAEMSAAHAALRTELAGASTRNRAVNAYARPRSS